MHTKLLNLGFVRMPDGSYYNNEIGLRVHVKDEFTVIVETPSGPTPTGIKDLENAIIDGGFGVF